MLSAVLLYAVAAVLVTGLAGLALLPDPADAAWLTAAAAPLGAAIGAVAVRREARLGNDTPAGQRRAAWRALRLAVLLGVRGLLLWVVVPLGLVVWLVAWPVALVTGRTRPRPGWVVAWFDGLLATGLDAVLGRPLGPDFRRSRWGKPPRWRTRASDLL